VLHPIVQTTRFFEQDHITLCHVYPALKTLKRHLTQQKDSLNVDITVCLPYWRMIAGDIRHRQGKLSDMDLVKVAFWLTSFGSTCLARQNEFIPESHRFHLEYEHPRQILVRGPLDVMTVEAVPGPAVEFDESDLADYEYTDDSITEESLRSVPRIQVRRGQTLTFIHELLVRFLREDLPPSQLAGDETSELIDIDSSIRFCVEELIRLFFCSDEYVSRCQDRQAAINKQIELWNFLSRNAPERPYDRVVDKIILILSIPASEASCKRSFSRQLRIMGHLRVNSNRDLLRARFQLKGGPSE
jgi:hypothetical protein